jgi:pSer/pThr/pTyr-binding forkhead associated (FHA) protein
VWVTLELRSNFTIQRKVNLVEGKSVVIGRAPGVDVSVRDDTFMSSVHCALELGPRGCRLIDRDSGNGTFLNGVRIREAVVRDGDEITAGHTTFVVRIVETAESSSTAAPSMTPPAPPAPGKQAADSKSPLFSIGSWSFGVVPSGWETIEQHGIRRAGKDIFPSNAVVSEEPLPTGKTLQEYVDSQAQILQSLNPELKAEAPTPASVSGAEEVLGVQIRHTTEDGRLVLQRQLYARAKQLVGVLTFTTLQSELPAVQTAFENILSGAAFVPQ